MGLTLYQLPHRTDLPVKLHCNQCVHATLDSIRGGVACSLARDLGVSEVILLNGLTAKLAPRTGGMQNPQEVDACSDFDADVATLRLGDRAYWILFEMEIYTIKQLCKKTPLDLLAHPNLGNKSLKQIQQALADRGLALMPDKPRPIIYQSQPGER